MLEIYQPLIVGFLAVSLGFVASAGLEIWKDRVRANAARRQLRNALIFEFRMLRQSLEFQKTRSKTSGKLYRFALYLPLILDQIERTQIGALSYAEVCALADFTYMKERLHSIVDGDEGCSLEKNYLVVSFNEGDGYMRDELVERFIVQSEAVLEELERGEANRIDWRRSLPPHLQKDRVFP